jgi:putative tricarboxylic transport membrane protein
VQASFDVISFHPSGRGKELGVLDALTSAISHMGSSEYWIAFLIALGIATVIGLIPGIGSTVTMAVALPIIVLSIHEPAIGILMLAVITGTGNTFDSIPAQLMGIVNAGTQVTFLEGHQLTRKGLGAYSLGAVYAVSAIGGLVGALCLLIAMPLMRPFILSMSFGEIAVLALFGIAMVGVLSHGAMLKGLTSGAIGVFLGTVGLQAYTSVDRFTFGVYDLQSGLPLVAVVAGFMAVPEMLDLAVSRMPVSPADAVVSNREVFRGFREGLRRWKMAIRHSVIGVALGSLPGTGGSVVTWISYGIGMALTKDKSEFGKGSLDGLLFAESSENAKEGGQAIPTLALGVPGSTSWALVLAAMLFYGITPGPSVLSEHSDIVGLIVISFALANLFITLLALLVTRQMMRVTQIPYAAVVAAVLPIVILGAFFNDPTLAVIPIVAVFTVLGLLMKQFGWPRPPLVLGFILSSVIEDNLWSALGVHGLVGMLTRPLTLILLAVVIVTSIYLHRTMMRSKAPVAEELEQLEEEVEHSAEAAYLASTASPQDTSISLAEIDVEQSSLNDFDQRRFYWRKEHLLPIAFMILSTWAIVDAITFGRMAAKYLPITMATVVFALSLAQLIIQARNPTEEREGILDLDLRSVGIEGSKRAAIITVILLVIYIAAIVLTGLKWAGVVFAVLTPLALMETRSKYLVSVLSVAFYAAFVVLVGDHLLGIYWPDGLFF